MDNLKGRLVVAVLRLMAALPWAVVQRLGAWAGWLLWLFPTRARSVVRINVQRCFPELSERERATLVRENLREIGKTFAESACIWLWPAARTLSLVREVEGLEAFQRAQASGKGVVIVASHLGNWEILGPYLATLCNPVLFYRPPKLAAVDELLRQQRARQGNRTAPSTKEGILAVMREVRRGGVVGIPADPEPSVASGVFVPFLAVQAALTSKFVPTMVAGHKAEAVFIHAIRLEDGSGFRVIFEAAPEALYSHDENTAVTAMSQTIARYAQRWPTQYMWSMKRFKRRPAGEKRWY